MKANDGQSEAQGTSYLITHSYTSTLQDQLQSHNTLRPTANQNPQKSARQNISSGRNEENCETTTSRRKAEGGGGVSVACPLTLGAFRKPFELHIIITFIIGGGGLPPCSAAFTSL